MAKLKLYLDCDGVILDTINKSYKMMKDRNISLDEEPEVRIFYSELDWRELIYISGEIDDSISKIKILSNFFDVAILTHVNSEKEAEVKRDYFAIELPGISVITVPKSIDKCEIINPEGAILVDDHYPNLKKWRERGGIPIKFSDSGRKYDCIVINDLLSLLEIKFDNGKVKAK